MKAEPNLNIIPQEFQNVPWVQSVFMLLKEQAERIQKQAEQIDTLKQTVQELKDEINRLKKMPKRPKFRPQGGKPTDRSGKPGGSSKGKENRPYRNRAEKKREELRIKPENLPEGSKFKGFQNYAVQELEIIPKEIIYKLEVWEAPDGSIRRGVLPKEVAGKHFGSEVRALIHNLYSVGVTQPALFKLINESGLDISEGQIHNLLVKESEGYEETREEILKAGLEEAPYIRTDDTGAKHNHKSEYCTHIGGKYFAYYKTTASKSRANFLTILLQGKEGYTVNEAFIWHLFQAGVSDDTLNMFENIQGKRDYKKRRLTHLLNRLGIENKKLRAQCLEAGLIGFISEKILKPEQILLSDRAGQFAVFNHAGCWVHMERPLRKLEVTSPEVEKELSRVRGAIWDLYDKVKDAAFTQDSNSKAEVHELYDKLTAIRSVSPQINQVITSFRNYREELLKALECPELPLHNNDSERDIRGVAKRRNISGSTKSSKGKIFRDGLLTLQQTCARLGISFWGYLNDWFGKKSINLAQIIRDRYRADSLT